ncbi:hypothetical protein LARI1_G005614 [Lachnellula arida]|uniref:Uncharacterized protein n=1 Tax=Lachnellula arida TaxID=1316785 RepID=A0A8T9BDA0_9HELO|nr:hypothetical protein LARI1_G005614 [Lachnellula arida]
MNLKDFFSVPENPFIFDSGDLQIIATYRGKRIIGSVRSSAWKKFVYPPFEQLCDSSTPTKSKATVDGGQERSKEQSNAAGVAREDRSNDNPPTDEVLQVKQKPENTMAKQLDFSDDDGDALLLLLHIVHLQFQYVPLKPEFPLLLQVAVLCDMYDCVQLVQPWLFTTWLVDGLDTAVGTETGHALFIAWVFGLESTFYVLVRKLMEEIEVDESGECHVGASDLKEYMPPGILERIKLARNSIIGLLLEIPYTQVEQIMSLQRSASHSCRHKKGRCDMLVYGSLTIALVLVDLWPKRAPGSITISIKELVKQLETLRVEVMETTVSRHCQENHNDCNNNIGAKVAAVLQEEIQIAGPDHFERLLIQRLKLTELVLNRDI